MVRIYSFDDEIPQDLVDTVATRIRVATWPGDIVVPATQTLLAFPTVVLPNGGQMAGYVEIDEQLDPSVDPAPGTRSRCRHRPRRTACPPI